MIRALLLLALAAPDGGYDSPWIEARDAGRVVCMTEATAVQVAGSTAGLVVVQRDEEAALLKTDPAPLTVVLWTIAGALSGAAIGVGVTCATGHCR